MTREILLLRSSDLSQGNSNQGRLEVTVPVKGTYLLLEFSVNDRLFNVNSNNNKVYLRINSTTNYTKTLTPGYYSLAQLASELSTQLNTISGQTFTVTSDSKTGKMTVSIMGDNEFNFTFNTNKLNSARIILGFSQVDTNNGSVQTSDNSADLTPCKTIFCRIGHDPNVVSNNHLYTSLLLSGDSQFGGVFRYKLSESYPQMICFNTSTKSVGYHFHDDKNETIDFNGCEWMMLLQKISD